MVLVLALKGCKIQMVQERKCTAQSQWSRCFIAMSIHMYIYIYTQDPTELWKKKNVSIYRRRLSMIEKLRTFFFHNYFFHNYFFSIILSVTVCPSIRNLNAF